MYQLLTGSLPHRGKNAFDTMKSIIDDPIPRPALLNPRIGPALERVLMRALAKEPEERFPTARDMQLDIEQFAHPARCRPRPPAGSRPRSGEGLSVIPHQRR